MSLRNLVPWMIWEASGVLGKIFCLLAVSSGVPVVIGVSVSPSLGWCAW